MERRAGSRGFIFLAVDLPCIRVVWNNFAWTAIRDIQIGMLGGREHGTHAPDADGTVFGRIAGTRAARA